MIKKVNQSTFDREITNIEGICLVDFYATWCGPCMRLSPVLEEIANSRSDYSILKVDVDENPEISRRHQIDTIPTICIYKNGKLVEKQVGFKNKEQIIKLIEKYSD